MSPFSNLVCAEKGDFKRQYTPRSKCLPLSFRIDTSNNSTYISLFQLILSQKCVKHVLTGEVTSFQCYLIFLEVHALLLPKFPRTGFADVARSEHHNLHGLVGHTVQQGILRYGHQQKVTGAAAAAAHGSRCRLASQPHWDPLCPPRRPLLRNTTGCKKLISKTLFPR